MANSREFPVARSDSSMVVRNGELMVWGGYTQTIYGEGEGSFIVPINLPDPDGMDAVIEIFNLETMEWRQVHTHGPKIPILGKGSASALHGKHLYVFGGLDDEDYRNDLYQLDLDDFTWKEMPMNGNPPCPRSYGGMVVHGECLIIFGGIGKPIKSSGLTPSECGAQVIRDEKFGGEFESEWNNYIHEYNTVTGKWRELGCTGSRPPPLERFSFDRIDSHRALLFGGKRGLFTAGYHDIYILDLHAMHWTGPIGPSANQQWPTARGVHATACVVDPESDLAPEHQQIVLFWGEGLNAIHLEDIWLLHIASMTWKKLGLFNLVARKYHMCCSFFKQERTSDMIVYGGNKRRKSKLERNVMTDMLIVKFGGVRRLKDICINFVKQNLGYYDLALIPPVLKRELLQENIELYTVYYYHEIAI